MLCKTLDRIPSGAGDSPFKPRWQSAPGSRRRDYLQAINPSNYTGNGGKFPVASAMARILAGRLEDCEAVDKGV